MEEVGGHPWNGLDLLSLVPSQAFPHPAIPVPRVQGRMGSLETRALRVTWPRDQGPWHRGSSMFAFQLDWIYRLCKITRSSFRWAIGTDSVVSPIVLHNWLSNYHQRGFSCQPDVRQQKRPCRADVSILNGIAGRRGQRTVHPKVLRI